MLCKLKEGEPICPHIQKIHIYVEKLHKINVLFDDELAIDMVLNSLPPSYDQLVLAYHLNNTEKTLTELHKLLQTAESGMKRNHASNANKSSCPCY